MSTKKTKTTPKLQALNLLGAVIKEQRGRNGLTKQGLAAALDLSVAYISLIERGGRNPPITTVLAIAKALPVPAARLVDHE